MPYIDQSRIGAIGICVGAGYTVNTAIQGRRIKVIGTVSTVNVGSMFRNGWNNSVRSIAALLLIEIGSNARTTDAEGKSAWLGKIRQLARENCELRQANEILSKASAYFAKEELDCRFRP